MRLTICNLCGKVTGHYFSLCWVERGVRAETRTSSRFRLFVHDSDDSGVQSEVDVCKVCAKEVEKMLRLKDWREALQ